MKKVSNYLTTLLLLYLSITTGYAQNFKRLFSEADSGNSKAQYELIMALKPYLTSEQPDKKLKDYFLKDQLYETFNEQDTLLVEEYQVWINDYFLFNLMESADNGYDKAQFEMGKYFESQDDFGSELRAYHWMTKSAEQNNSDAQAWLEEKNESLYLKKYLLPEDYERVDFYVRLFDLSEKLCHIFYKNWQEKEAAEKVEHEIAQFLQLEEDDPDRMLKIIDFWNAYNKYFICEDTLDSEQLKYAHLLKKSLISLDFRDNQQLFDWLFELNTIKAIDFNQIIYFDNQPQTLVDALGGICRNPEDYEFMGVKEVYELRKKLIDEYNAKTAYRILKE